jgi:hypothetical protein
MTTDTTVKKETAQEAKLWSFKTSNRFLYILLWQVLPPSIALLTNIVSLSLPNTIALVRAIYAVNTFLFLLIVLLSLKPAGDDYIEIDSGTGMLTWFAERKFLRRKQDVEFQKPVTEITSANACLIKTLCWKTNGLEVIGSGGFSRQMPSYMSMDKTLVVAEQINQALSEFKTPKP